jgi:magnesium-transporting ATPase (P-type)
MSAAANPKTMSEVAAWHAMSVDEVVKRLTTDTGRGLDAAEAANRLQKCGPNRLPEGKKRGQWHAMTHAAKRNQSRN